MIGFTSELRAAHTIVKNDWFKLGGRLVRVLDSYPQGKLEQVIRFYFTDMVEDGVTVCTAILPRRVEIKVYKQCQIHILDHDEQKCEKCGLKK